MVACAPQGLVMSAVIIDILATLALPAALFGIHAWFRSRQGAPPGRVERFLATSWLLIRRIVCFGAAGLCVFGAVFVVRGAVLGGAGLMTPVGVLLLLSVAGLFFHWGRYGAGYRRGDLSEDRPVHESRRKRYGWRW
jgi:hypothetical protein